MDYGEFDATIEEKNDLLSYKKIFKDAFSKAKSFLEKFLEIEIDMVAKANFSSSHINNYWGIQHWTADFEQGIKFQDFNLR